MGNHSKHETPGGYGIPPCVQTLERVSVPAVRRTAVKLPAGSVDRSYWSADGRRFAFANAAKDAVELWIGDTTTGALRKVSGIRLNPMLDGARQRMPEHRALLVKLGPDPMGSPPPKPLVPAGPSIQETGKGDSSTYETRDTLKRPHDEDLFDWYARSQVALVDAGTLAVKRVGKAGNIADVDPAPDGQHLLVTTLHKPYSYVTRGGRGLHARGRHAHRRLLLLAGHAIIDRASFPVIGDPKGAYDDYLPQLVADAKAAVDEAVRLGVADPDRIVVTGHSHGALMTADLLAHSDLFRAGVATSGSYNKTLTPFGFQNERRSVWEAPEVCTKVSPFFMAAKLFEAIRGNGGTARLLMLPHEPHWYSAMESQEQQIHEMVRWLDPYVKNAAPRAGAPAAASAAAR